MQKPPPDIVVVDYDAGNLRSVERALQAVGQRPLVTSDPRAVARAEALVLPGVGSAQDCMRKLRSRGAILPGSRSGEFGARPRQPCCSDALQTARRRMESRAAITRPPIHDATLAAGHLVIAADCRGLMTTRNAKGVPGRDCAVRRAQACMPKSSASTAGRCSSVRSIWIRARSR